MSESPTEPTTTYEQAREELADVVRKLEAGGLTLEESLALWEGGEQLAALCPHWLAPGRRGGGGGRGPGLPSRWLPRPRERVAAARTKEAPWRPAPVAGPRAEGSKAWG